MKILNYKFSLSTEGYTDIKDISSNVLEIIKESGISNGNVLVFAPGSTCGITTMEYESGCIDDLLEYYLKVAPVNQNYKHNIRWGDGNGFSHIRSAITKTNFIFPVVNSKPILGDWQQIVFLDFDNRAREREIHVQIIGE